MSDDAREAPLDAHLRQALRHAPDRDAVPPAALSASILAQARAAVQPVPPRHAPAAPWWSRLWQQMATPAFGGAFASVMLAGVIGVMWQDGPPPEALPGAERETAKAPAAAPMPAPVPAAAPAAAPPVPSAAVQDTARADQPPQAAQVPTMPAQKAAPPVPLVTARAPAPAPKPAESAREVPAAPPAAETRAAPAPSGAADNRQPGAAAGPRANTAPEAAPAPAPAPATAAAPAVTAVPLPAPVPFPATGTAQAPGPAPAPAPAPAAKSTAAAAPVGQAPVVAPASPPAPAAVAPARSILQEASRDAAREVEAQPRSARREASASGALGAASLARLTPPLDPLAAPLAALSGAAPDDARARDARQALLDARRLAVGPWQPAEPPSAEPTIVVVSPDGAPLGRLWIDDRAVTWQPARGPALKALKAPPPR